MARLSRQARCARLFYVLPPDVMNAARTLWDFHQMHHEPRRTDIAIGLGSHDLGGAEHTADLYHQGLFQQIVFTGANAPTTAEIFPVGRPSTTRNEPRSSEFRATRY